MAPPLNGAAHASSIHRTRALCVFHRHKELPACSRHASDGGFRTKAVFHNPPAVLAQTNFLPQVRHGRIVLRDCMERFRFERGGRSRFTPYRFPAVGWKIRQKALVRRRLRVRIAYAARRDGRHQNHPTLIALRRRSAAATTDGVLGQWQKVRAGALASQRTKH